MVANPLLTSIARAEAHGSRSIPAAARTQVQQDEPWIEAATVRHAPVLNGARIDGSLRLLTGESLTLKSGQIITGGLIAPGTPKLQIDDGAQFGGTTTGAGDPHPDNYSVTLETGTTLGGLLNRTDSIQLRNIPTPPLPRGQRAVTLTTPGQSPGDYSTLRDLTLAGEAGLIEVPPGAYGVFLASGQTGFVFGVRGSQTPAVYSLKALALNANTRLEVVGPVILNLATTLVSGGRAGAEENPEWLKIHIAGGGSVFNTGGALYGELNAASTAGTVILNPGARIKGAVKADRLILNRGAALEGVDVTQPNQPALTGIAPSAGRQSQIMQVRLTGRNTKWVQGVTRVSLGGEISVGGAPYGEPGPVTVESETTATAEIAISPTASLGPRSIAATTATQRLTRTDGFFVEAASPPGAANSTVSTYAGKSGESGFADGKSTDARFHDPAGLAVAPNDVIYAADAGNHRIRRIALDGAVATIAGNGTSGFADGPASTARFNHPQGIAVGPGGELYVADAGNHRIRRIDAAGNVTTLAGDGEAGFLNGPGSTARFNDPRGVAVDEVGNVYVADTGNSAVRRISPIGEVQTVAGDGTVGNSDEPNPRFNRLSGVAYDAGRLFVYISDTQNHRIRLLSPGRGGVVTIAGLDRGFSDGDPSQARFAEPEGIAPDGAGRLIIADAANALIRAVHLEKARSKDPRAVATIAGTGSRGGVDGTGAVASFSRPQGIVVQRSSAVIVADAGNHVLRRILQPPVIADISPLRGVPGSQVVVTGERFDGREPGRNRVRFAKSSGGQTNATVLSASRTEIIVSIPADAVTGPLTVTTEGGTAVSATNFEVLTPGPVIADFTPRQGNVGDTVTLTGANLKQGPDAPAVTFTGVSDARIPALVTFSSPTETRVTVPNGAVTGFIESTTSGGRVRTGVVFSILARQDFYLSVSPSQINTVRGSAGVGVVYLNSGVTSFTQLARLGASGLPSGVTVTFDPAQITAGGQSTLRLAVASGVAAGSYPFTVKAEAVIDGAPLSRETTATLIVQAGGQTTLAGLVLSTRKEPVIGATVSLDGKTATTDAAGAFLLSGVNAGTGRPVMVDGRTASSPNRAYPVIIEPADIIAGEANTIPYTFYLPPVDVQFETNVVPGQNTMVTSPRVPGLAMMIPAGANLRNRDGSPVTQSSITPVPIDRTPAPLPSNVNIPQVFTSQPGGAIADVEMPVVYPNLAGRSPGTRVDLWAFNHDTVQWYVYGSGRVSPDGRTIAPETNPATGRPYGLRDFSWHGPNAGREGDTGGEGDCPPNNGANPVNLSTGIKLEYGVDVAFGGARGGVAFLRTYSSDKSQNCLNCPFGSGWTHSYDVKLTGDFAQGGAGRARMPFETTGRLFSYARTDADGALIFTSTATIAQLADVIRKLPNGTLEYRSGPGGVMQFDPNGRLTALRDRNGNTTNLQYTGANLTRITDAVGRSVDLEYNAGGKIQKITDPVGRVWNYSYEITGGISEQLSAVTDPLGRTTRYLYTGEGRLAVVIDARGNQVKRLSYDANGRVTKQQFADGGAETYEYSLSGTIVTGVRVTDAMGRVTSRRFEARGYTLEMTDGLGQTTVFNRDLTTSLSTSSAGPCGCTEGTRTFDERGNPLSGTDRLGHTVQMEYEPVFNKITKIVNELGQTTTYVYDARGNLISSTNPLGQTTNFAYDQYGLLTSVTDALGHTTRHAFDADGNLTAQIDALGARWTFEHDAIGRRTASIDPLGRRSSVVYDEVDQTKSATDSSGAVTHYEYDANGNLSMMTDALNRSQVWEYDEKDRMIAAVDALDRATRFDYNLNDEIIKGSTPSGRTVFYDYDARGQRVSARDPMGKFVRFSYDYYGGLTTLTDQRGSVMTMSYDELHRPVAMRDPLGRTTSVRYDARGDLTSITDRLGRQITLSYDALRRPIEINYADAAVAVVYDAAGRPTRIDDSQSGFLSWTYDDADRMLTESSPVGVVRYAYNPANQRVSMTAANRPVVNYGYDAAGRLSTISQGGETYTHAYDPLSRRVSLTRPNGVTTNYVWDEVHRLSRMTHSSAAGAPLEQYSYGYNQEDEIISLNSLASATLLPAAKTAGPADAANRISQFGNARYDFDPEGQTVSKTDGNGVTRYIWDARGRLSSVAMAGGREVGYTYDALGRRSSRTAAGARTNFLYDGSDIVLDQPDNAPSVDYLHGLGVDEHLRQGTPQNGAYFLQDHLGSTSALTSADGGVLERAAYEPFGSSAAGSLTRYGYTGRERDSDTSLLHYRNREYDAEQGRFLTEDPAGLGAGLNLYEYSGSSPLNFNDPFGLSFQTFVQGLASGGAQALIGAFVIGAVFSALTAATAGTSLAVLVPLLGAVVGAAAVYALVEQVNSIRKIYGDCPDSAHYKIGELLGGLLGGGILGRSAFQFGSRTVGKYNLPGSPPSGNLPATSAGKTATQLSVDDKLARYLLNQDHPLGGAKAKFFKEALGYTSANSDALAKQLIFDPNRAVQTAVTEYGTKYNQIIDIVGANGRVIPVRVAWIQNNDGVVRLVTAVPDR